MKSKGFTLIELIMVIAILGIIAIMASTLLAAAIKANHQSQNEVNAASQARLALRRMADEMRNIHSASVATLNCSQSQQLTFTDLSGSQIIYKKTSDLLQRQENGGANRTVLTGLDSLTFTCLDASHQGTTDSVLAECIKVEGSVYKYDITIPFQTIVCPRNF